MDSDPVYLLRLIIPETSWMDYFPSHTSHSPPSPSSFHTEGSHPLYHRSDGVDSDLMYLLRSLIPETTWMDQGGSHTSRFPSPSSLWSMLCGSLSTWGHQRGLLVWSAGLLQGEIWGFKTDWVILALNWWDPEGVGALISISKTVNV